MVVNADDFGYFPAVSRGILEAVDLGVVTATSVFANELAIEGDVEALVASGTVDVGVHLNLTRGAPLSKALRERLARNSFPGKYWWAQRCLFEPDWSRLVAQEWRAQIERILSFGVPLWFLNSHEHVHMLPGLMPLTRTLAEEYAVPFVRHSMPDWFYSSRPRYLFRNSLMQALAAMNARHAQAASMPRMLGLSVSGRLDLKYAESALARLPAGGVAELMCHPGYVEPSLPVDSPLRAYHDWEGELRVLTGDAFRGLLDRYRVALIRFSDIRRGLVDLS